MSVLISALNLIKNYGDHRAVAGISFEVNEGECFGLLGPNGAGKTSTFKMIYGSTELTSGELFVLGLNVRDHIKKIKSLIGVVPQENGLDTDFSVLDNLLIYGRYYGLSKVETQARARELLKFIQLEDYALRKITALSGGMQRRLTIARALIHKPKLLLLDEPTTGLDPQARNWIWEELSAMKKNGSTMVLTTHYMEEAEVLCDRILIIDKGVVVAQGRPSELIQSYVGREVVEFDVNSSEIEYYCQKLQNLFEFQAMRSRIKVFIRGPVQTEEVIQHVPNRHLVVRRASLNDVFLRLSGHELSEGERPPLRDTL